MSTRRSFLTGALAAGSVLPVGAALAAEHPDAELIAVCAEFDSLDHQQVAIFDGPTSIPDDDEADAAAAPVFERMNVLLDHMEDMRATTAFGIQARAHSLTVHGGHGQYDFGYVDSMVGRLLSYLMRDAAALGGREATIVRLASPDAELLAACAALDELERAYCATDFGCEPESPADLAADAERERLSDAQGPFVDRICELRALTREGQAARARSLVFWKPCLIKDNSGGCTDDRLIYAVLRDLIG